MIFSLKILLYALFNQQAFLAAVSCATATDLQALETQPAGRSVQTSKTANTISIPQKPDQYYQQHVQTQSPQLQHLQLQQAHQQAYPVQYIPTPLYQQQQQPQPAMIIIAQPPQVTPQAMLTHAAQHLLNYFHSNPQARYQFLQGNYQPQPTQGQPAYVAQPVGVPAYTYQVTSVQPQYHQSQGQSSQSSPPFVPSQQISSTPIQQIHQQQVAQQQAQMNSGSQEGQYAPQYVPQSIQIPVIGPFGHSTHIPHIATLAQLTTQKYLPQPLLRTSHTPAIITGLENFTPEQQAQIKAQLQSGGPITPLKASLPPNFGASLQQQNNAAIKPTPAPQTQSTSPQEFPSEDEDKTQQGTQQIPSSTSYNSGITYGNQFNKG